MITFAPYAPPEAYEPPPRREGDSDVAHARYCAGHYVKTMHAARCFTEDGEPVERPDFDGGTHAEARQMERDDLVLLDAASAGIYVQIADALQPHNRAKLLGLPLSEGCRMAWRVAS